MAKLILIEDGTAKEVQMGQELTIGRAYSNLLRLEGEEISRVHCIIYRRGEDFILRDLDSKNGVMLNGQKVGNIVISPGDTVVVGKYTLLFDPPSGFDLDDFLQRHNASPPAGNGGAPEAAATEKEIETAGESVDQTLHTFHAETSQVFFTIGEVEGMTDTQVSQHSTQFLAEMLRLHRQLGITIGAEDTDSDEALFEHFLAAAVAALGADRGVVVLRDETGDVLRLGAIMPKDKDVSVNRVVLRTVLREHKAVLCNDTQNDSRFLKTDTVKREQIGSLIAFPLMQGDTATGLVYADAQNRPNAFRREHLLLLSFVARLLALLVRTPVKG
jgi:hypothetical protein